MKLLFSADIIEEKVIFTEDITEEWNHGAYEGLKKKEEILRLRKDKSLNNDRESNVWSDGGEGGEQVA